MDLTPLITKYHTENEISEPELGVDLEDWEGLLQAEPSLAISAGHVQSRQN